jgi:hypothetical protein
LRRAAAIGLAVVALASHAAAQETRSDLLERERTEKAATLHPNQPSRIERVLFEIEDRDLILRLFNPPRGLFVRWGGLPEGAGFGAGPAVRYSNHDYSATLTSVFTTRGYWELDGRLAFPNLADRNMFAEVGVRGHDFPQEDFYGFGPDSPDAKLSYGLFERSAHALVGVWPGHEWFTATAEVEYLSPEVDRGTDPLFPSIHVVLPPTEVPGLVEQPDFLRTGATININNLDAPFGTSLGGYYTVSYHRYLDRDLDRYSFNRFRADLRQFIPIVNNARQLALRLHFDDLAPEGGQEVPFYMQPTLGGGYSLRSLPSYRLRDRSLVLFQAEYRIQANPFITTAIFYDTGTVAPRPADLDLGNMTHDWGIGIRAGYMATAAMRVDLAFGKEGPRLVFKFSNAF